MYKDLIISVFDKLKKLGINYKILEDEKLYISFLVESGYLINIILEY